MNDFDTLAATLAPHYSRFRVEERLLFTGHSHQAWPDVAREGLTEAYDVAARDVDAKWATAFARTQRLRAYLRGWYDDPDGRYCLGVNTHQLLVSWLSALDWHRRQRIVTTDGEFHSMARQLRRLQELGVEVVALPSAAPEHLADGVEAALETPTTAVMMSRVFFETARVNPELGRIAELCRVRRVPLLIDDYHGTNVVPISLRNSQLTDCHLITGGYKYLQWGEGNCFLRFPADCPLRPAVTGWFAAFDTLSDAGDGPPVRYDDEQRFAGATYDPCSQFRAARVADFFDEHGLTPAVLRAQVVSQVDRLRAGFLACDFDPAIIRLAHATPASEAGGFLALHSVHAAALCDRLRQRGVLTDARGEMLRFGPAPYTRAAQIDEAIEALHASVGELVRDT